MKLLVVSDLYPPVAFGGYELDCASFVEGLRHRHEVTVLTSRLRRESAPAEPHIRRELPWAGRDSRLRASGVAPLAAARGVRVVRRVLDELKPDLVFVFNAVGIPQAVPAAALEAGVPVAFRLSETFFATELFRGDRFLRHLHGGEPWPRAAWGFAMRAVNRADPALRLHPARASRVAISWASENLRSRTTLPAGMAVALEQVIYPASQHAADLADLERRPFDRPTVLYLGRVTPGKGIEVAYRALDRLRRCHGVDARLLVVGHANPDVRRSLDRLAAQLGVIAHVEHWGYVDSARFNEALQGSHAIVVPSVEPDVFPLVIVEAALARIPVVASRVGGIPEAVEDRRHALLFEAGDAEGCASALAQTFDDPSAAVQRAASAFARMRELSMENYVEASDAFVVDARAALTGGR